MTYVRYAVKTIERLTSSLRYYAAAVHHSRNTEAIHQLRVISRRLRNAVWIFNDLWPKNQRRPWIQAIKTVGASAGEARDLDIQIQFLRQFKRRSEKSFHAALDAFVSALKDRRKKIYPQILEQVDIFLKKRVLEDIEAALKQCLNFPEKNAKDKLSRKAAAKVKKRLAELWAFEPFVSQPKKINELHQMRIAAKHVRYTLEALRPLYGESADSFIDAILRVHRTLGALHDDDVWLARLARMRARGTIQVRRDVIQDIKNFVLTHRQKVYRRFVKSWKKALDRWMND